MKTPNVVVLKKIQKIIQYGGLILLGILFLSFLIPAIFGTRSYIISSNSMQPTLSSGDIVYVKPIAFDQIEVDDIMTFSSPTDPSKTFTHRVIQVIDSEQLLVTKGDANETMDPSPSLYENAVGKVVFSLPWFGNIILFIRSTWGIISVVALFIAYVSFDLYIAYLDQKKTSKTTEGEASGKV